MSQEIESIIIRVKVEGMRSTPDYSKVLAKGESVTILNLGENFDAIESLIKGTLAEIKVLEPKARISEVRLPDLDNALSNYPSEYIKKVILAIPAKARTYGFQCKTWDPVQQSFRSWTYDPITRITSFS